MVIYTTTNKYKEIKMLPKEVKMEFVGTHIPISWSYAQPFHYGTYKGTLKNGNRPCTIDVDWKIKVFNEHSEQVGTDEIAYWLCDANHVKAFLDELDNIKNH